MYFTSMYSKSPMERRSLAPVLISAAIGTALVVTVAFVATSKLAKIQKPSTDRTSDRIEQSSERTLAPSASIHDLIAYLKVCGIIADWHDAGLTENKRSFSVYNKAGQVVLILECADANDAAEMTNIDRIRLAGFTWGRFLFYGPGENSGLRDRIRLALK